MKISRILPAAAAAMALLTVCSCGDNGAEQREDTEKGYENPVVEAIMERRSIRKYQDRPVDRKLLYRIAECGINAPNAMNAQQWEIRIVDDAGWIDGMSRLQLESMPEEISSSMTSDPSFRNTFRNGQALFIVAVKPDGMTLIDAGLLGENIMLAAHSFGLGTCCLGSSARFLTSPAASEYLDSLQFSEGYEVQYIIACGYPDETPEAKPRNTEVIKFI